MGQIGAAGGASAAGPIAVADDTKPSGSKCRGCGHVAPWGESCYVCGRRQDPEKLKWTYLVRRTILPLGRGTEKHLLRTLSDHVWAGHSQGIPGRVDGECVLLHSTLAREMSMSVRSIQRATDWLEGEGIIEVEPRGRKGGGRGANRFRLLPSNPYEPDEANTTN